MGVVARLLLFAFNQIKYAIYKAAAQAVSNVFTVISCKYPRQIKSNGAARLNRNLSRHLDQICWLGSVTFSLLLEYCDGYVDTDLVVNHENASRRRRWGEGC